MVLVLLSETEAQIIKTRSKGKHIELETTISALKTRAEAPGCTKRYKFVRGVNHWIVHHFAKSTTPNPHHDLTGWLREGNEVVKEPQITCGLT